MSENQLPDQKSAVEITRVGDGPGIITVFGICLAQVTKAQAEAARYGEEFHYTGKHQCRRHFGPKGGVTEDITRVRVTGACKTWKTRPESFRLPVKYGLRESSAIDKDNAHDFHAAKDCPLEARNFPKTLGYAQEMITLRELVKAHNYRLSGFDSAGCIVLAHATRNEGIEFQSLGEALRHFENLSSQDVTTEREAQERVDAERARARWYTTVYDDGKWRVEGADDVQSNWEIIETFEGPDAKVRAEEYKEYCEDCARQEKFPLTLAQIQAKKEAEAQS